MIRASVVAGAGRDDIVPIALRPALVVSKTVISPLCLHRAVISPLCLHRVHLHWGRYRATATISIIIISRPFFGNNVNVRT